MAVDSGVFPRISVEIGHEPRARAKFRAKFIKVHGRKLGGDLELGIAWNAGQEPNNDAYHSREFNAQRRSHPLTNWQSLFLVRFWH